MSNSATEYIYPKTVSEAVEALQADGAHIIAGGTDLVIEIKEGKRQCARLVDVTGIPEMTGITLKDDVIEIGAAVSFRTIAKHEIIRTEFAALAEAASRVGSPQIRNRGTIGGNLSTGSSAGDTLCPLTAFDADVCIVDAEGEHIVPMKDFWKKEARETLSTKAVLSRIILHRNGTGWNSTFIKLGRRESLAISRISLTVAVAADETGTICEARMAIGSAGRYAYRVPAAEEHCLGVTADKVDGSLVKKALSEAVYAALGTRSTVKYKAQAIQGLYDKAATAVF